MKEQFRCLAMALIAALPISAAGAASYHETFDADKAPAAVMFGILEIGERGAWMGELADGRYVLHNRHDRGAIRYYYLKNLGGSETGGQAEITVSIDVGGAFSDAYAGAGLVFGLDPERRHYFAFALLGGGQFGVFKRDANGFRAVLDGSYDAGADSAMNRLKIVLAGREMRFFINDGKVGNLTDDVAGAAVGLLALGTGRFEFDNFRVASDDRPRLESAAASPPDTPAPSPEALLRTFLDRQADPAKLSFALRPDTADYEAVFAGTVAMTALASYEPAWDQGRIFVQPKPGQTEVKIFSATTEQLRQGTGDARLFPQAYRQAATVMRPGLTHYGFRFVEPGETRGTVYFGLLFVNGRWMLFPKPWWAVVATKTAGDLAPVEWLTHEQPARFSLRHPADWAVQFDAARGLAAVAGPRGEQVRIWPFHVARSMSPEMGADILRQMAGRLAEATEWEAPATIGETGLRMAGYDGATVRIASLSVVPGAASTSGIFYMVSAPQGDFRGLQATFADLLRSFRPIGDADRPAMVEPDNSQSPSYIRFQDQAESAFTLDVPAGWNAQGGLRRISPIDVRFYVGVTAADNAARIFIGSWDLPPFVAPNRALGAAGFPEGSWYMPNGTAMQVRRYPPGVEFARAFAAKRFADLVDELRLGQARDRSALAEQITAIHRRHDVPWPDQRLDAGEVRFSGQLAGRPAAGYVFAGTTLSSRPEIGIDAARWSVPYLFGFVAERDRVDQTAAILARMVESFALDPAWAARQFQITGDRARAAADTGAAIARLVRENFAPRQPNDVTIARLRPTQILGVVDLVDPETQQVYRVESGANYYWVDPLGNVAGTRLAANPDGFRFGEALQLP